MALKVFTSIAELLAETSTHCESLRAAKHRYVVSSWDPKERNASGLCVTDEDAHTSACFEISSTDLVSGQEPWLIHNKAVGSLKVPGQRQIICRLLEKGFTFSLEKDALVTNVTLKDALDVHSKS